MSKNYYYLIASLPELHLDDNKEPYRVKDFVAELSEQLYPEHFNYVRSIISIYDNANIVDAVLGRDTPWGQQTGNRSFKEIRDLLAEDGFGFDEYIISSLKQIGHSNKEEKNLLRANLEDIIFSNYYRKMTAHENLFIQTYFKFDFQLRNILVALNKRKFNLENADFIDIEEDSYIVNKLRSNGANDFGLSGDIEYLQKLIESVNNNESIHIEKYIDQLRWNKIEEINTFKYFEIDVLLGFLLKLMLVERWIHLDEHKGSEIFDERAKAELSVKA
ncbi:MAG: DUF2764 family protein [Candidatus Omnitrophota bacterium]